MEVFRIPILSLKVLFQVPDMNEAILVSRHEEWILTTHVVDRHSHVDLGLLLEHTCVAP